MASMVEVSCKWCKCRFMARTADRARGWARFCSKSCKASKQEKRTRQNAAFQERRTNGNFDDDDILEGMSDMDFGASDGGGYERFDGEPA